MICTKNQFYQSRENFNFYFTILPESSEKNHIVIIHYYFTFSGLEHALQFTAVEKDGKKVVHVRSYKMILKKSGSRLPRVELEEMGPRMDLTLRRSHLASDDLFNTACKQIKARIAFFTTIFNTILVS